MMMKRNKRKLCEESLLAMSQSTISAAMINAGLNRNQLAKKMGVSRSWITRMLNGECLISVGTLALALEACGYEVTAILTARNWGRK